MAPGATDEKMADEDRATVTKKPVSRRPSSRGNANSLRKMQGKRAPKKPSRAVIKKKRHPAKSKAGKVTGRVTKRQRKADQSYMRMMTTRKLFVGHQSGDGVVSGNPAETTAYSGGLQKYIDNSSDVDEHVVEAERKMIQNALKRCGDKVDLSSPQYGSYSIRGITTQLTPIQVATLGWMLGREALRRTCERGGIGRGGILAHDMGLGKTLMALSLMVVTRTGLGKRKPEDCSTLVVVPNEAVATHWQEECLKHTSGVFKVSELARYKKLKLSNTVDTFRTPKIVFATYGELAREVPKKYREPNGPKDPEDPEDPEEPEDAEDENTEDTEHTEDTEEFSWPAIFEAKWYRVILDEAHTIKNRKTKASLAVRKLQKSCAWVITGTPLSNGQEEMYPYFNFLNMEGSEYPSTFAKTYFPKGMASPKFRAELADVMMQKRIGESFLGQPIIPLPTHHAPTRTLLPTSKERVILSFVESKIQATVEEKLQEAIGSDVALEEAFIKAFSSTTNFQEAIDSDKTVKAALLKMSSSVTTLLHIYRYAAIHPFLLEGAFMDVFSVDEVELLVQELERAEDDAEEGEETHDPKSLRIEELLKIAINHREMGKKKCPKCKKPWVINENVIYKLPCDHFLCYGCMSARQNHTAAKGLQLTCPDRQCSRKFVFHPDAKFYPTLFYPVFPEDDDEPQAGSDSEDSGLEPDEKPRKGRSAGKKVKKYKKGKNPVKSGPGIDVCGKEPALSSYRKRFFAYADTFLGKSKMVVPSAKIVGVQELIRERRQIAPEDKIIVFTQFTAVAKLVGRIAQLEDTKFLYYTGDLSEGARHVALNKFRNDSSVKLLITSLMCGGQGLNITIANRVILMELWWNSPAEEQAFARVYRMGQDKEVHVVRLRCAGTREDAIDAMQKMKESELEDCLMSRKTTRSNHSLHSIVALMGLPVMGIDGAVTGFKKSTEDDKSVVSEEEESEEIEESKEGGAEEGDGDEEDEDEDMMDLDEDVAKGAK